MCRSKEEGGQRCECSPGQRRQARLANRLGATPEARARLEALDPAYASGTIAQRVQVVAETHDRALLDTAIRDTTAVRQAAAASPALTAQQQTALAGHRDRTTRAVLAANVAVSTNILVGLSWDPSDTVRAAVAGNARLPDGSLHGLRTDRAPAVAAAARAAAAARRHTPRPARATGGDELMEAIEASRDPAYRAIVAKLAGKEGRAERRQQAREDRQAVTDAPLIAWLAAVRAGETALDLVDWVAARAA